MFEKSQVVCALDRSVKSWDDGRVNAASNAVGDTGHLTAA